MNKYAYFFDGENSVKDYTLLHNRMETEGCKIFEDKAILENTRPYWKLLVRGLSKGDKVYVASLSNAFRGVRELVFFLLHCQQHGIVMESLEEGISTAIKEDYKVLSAIMEIVKAVKTVRHSNDGNGVTGKSSTAIPNASIMKKKAEVEVLNMYTAGYTTDEIIKKSKYKSKSTVYDVLRRNGIAPERQKKKKK